MSEAEDTTWANVVYINSNLGRGGGEEVCRQWAAYLRRGGAGVGIINLGPNADVRPSFEALGCQVVQVDMHRDIDAVRSLRRLRRAVQAMRPNIVHTIGNPADLYGSVVARSLRIPAVLACGQNTLESWTTRARSAVAGRLVHRYVAASEACARSLRDDAHVPAHKIRVIHNGLDFGSLHEIRCTEPGQLRSELGLHASVPIVGTIGSLKDQKNYPRWLRIAAGVAMKVPDSHFVIIGGGPLEQELREVAAEYDLNGKIHLLGARADAQQLLRDFSVFLLASDREGFGLVLAEAQFLGIPVVATASGGVAEVVRDGVTGQVFPPSEEDAIASACVAVLLQPESVRAMVAAGPAWVESAFDGTRMSQQVCAEYRRVLDEAADG